ncbi:MAG: AMP-binding protein, partial [Acidimicrobiaceae bacterium]|nr:AMP-binding protein [Acidimicrobiaceae bacterium]
SESPQGVFDVLERPLRERPDAEALVCRQGRFSYAELDALASRAAGAWCDAGVRPGDRVAVSLPNDVDILGAFHGAMRLGAIWVGINRILAPPEKAYMVGDAEASVVLVDDPDSLKDRVDARIVTLDEWRDLVRDSSGRPNVGDPDPSAPAGIAYTSGTTGFPKGAVHCQAGLLQPGAATVARRGWGPGLRKGDCFALTILNMMVLTTLLTAQAGATSVIMDTMDVREIAEWIRKERVMIWNGAPAQLHTMVVDQSIEPAALASLDEVWSGGGDTPDTLVERFEARFGVRVSRSYGLTEAPALVAIDDLQGERPSGTSGLPLDHVAVSAPDGELVLQARDRGPWAGRYRPMLGYWRNPEATAAVLEGTTLRTGDLAEVGRDGRVKILGRRSQLIIRGGANVYPAEVERVLSTAPGVLGCAVVGVPNERLGERVAAVIEADGDLDEAAILEHCRRELAAYKVPERLAFVERLPRNAMGKVPRDALLKLLDSPRHM